MRLSYLRQHRRKLYQELVSIRKLETHLLNINDTANDWLDRMLGWSDEQLQGQSRRNHFL